MTGIAILDDVMKEAARGNTIDVKEVEGYIQKLGKVHIADADSHETKLQDGHEVVHPTKISENEKIEILQRMSDIKKYYEKIGDVKNQELVQAYINQATVLFENCIDMGKALNLSEENLANLKDMKTRNKAQKTLTSMLDCFSLNPIHFDQLYTKRLTTQ